MHQRANARKTEPASPRGAPPRRVQETGPALLAVQRSAGNQAATMLVQRATADQITSAKTNADADHAAGKIGPYFTGNFLANHIEDADPGIKSGKGAKSVVSSKEARSQAWKKLESRSDVDKGGSGWAGKKKIQPDGTVVKEKKITGANTLILDFDGTQKKILMRAVAIAEIDELRSGAPQRWFEFYSEESVPAVTYASDGTRTQSKGRAHLGALYEDNRYKIDHLSGVG